MAKIYHKEYKKILSKNEDYSSEILIFLIKKPHSLYIEYTKKCEK